MILKIDGSYIETEDIEMILACVENAIQNKAESIIIIRK